MNINDLFPRKWLAPTDLAGRTVTVTIQAVTLETVRNPRTQEQERKLCVAFKGAQKRMLCNKTQALAIADAVGAPDTDAWPARRITLSAGVAPNRQPTIVVTPAPAAAPAAALPAVPTPAAASTNGAASSASGANANGGDPSGNGVIHTGRYVAPAAADPAGDATAGFDADDDDADDSDPVTAGDFDDLF